MRLARDGNRLAGARKPGGTRRVWPLSAFWPAHPGACGCGVNERDARAI